MRNLLTILVAAAGMLASARMVAVPTMPVSPYADTEASTNVAINIAQSSYLVVEFHFSGTPTNNLELAFGTDVNTNGVLDAEETETRFGWRSGRYFIENALTWERFVSEPASGTQNLSVEMHLDIRYALQQVKRVNVTGTNASAFGELVSGVPPAWLWRREWNLMRATRRGTEPPSDWIDYSASHRGFAIRLR
jgi:hypothetical protein